MKEGQMRIGTRCGLAVCACALALATMGEAQRDVPDWALVLSNLTLIDGTGAAPRPGVAVVLRRERVEWVGPTGEVKVPDGAEVLDLTGRYAVPGLIDAHVHLAPLFAESDGRGHAELARMLRGGVVAARVMAGMAGPAPAGPLERDARSGALPAPDLYYAAVVAGPYFVESDARSKARRREGVAVIEAMREPAEAPGIVARATANGASALKLYAELPAPLLRALTEEAHRAGLQVWAHAVVYPERPLETVRAGVDTVSHACGLPWQDPDLDPAAFARINRDNRPSFDAGLVEPGGPEIAALLAEMARRQVVFDPTLHIQTLPHGAAIGCEPGLMIALTRAAHKAGVILAAGTDFHAAADDAYPALHSELETLVSTGVLTPLEAITAATRNGARALGLETTLGTIEPGKAAHVVVLRTDPSRDIRALRTVERVVKHGRVVRQ
jgi:imidazolonepropionase-like amidohydrolase